MVLDFMGLNLGSVMMGGLLNSLCLTASFVKWRYSI